MLVDTTVCIDFLRKNQNAAKFFETVFASGERISVSVITVAELFSGKDCEDNEKLNVLETFLSYFEVLETDLSIAKTAGFFRREYSISLPDAIIAATSLIHNQELISCDMKAFSKLKEIKTTKPY